MNSESESYIFLLDAHLRKMTHGLSQFPAECWDWAPSSAAPSAHKLAEHTLEWLRCDRMHVMVPDAQFHEDIPPSPNIQQELIHAIDMERDEWTKMLNSLRVEDLSAPRRQFNHPGADKQDVRWFVLNTLQNVIYNHGQLVTLYLALAPEGAPSYSPPLPQPYYEQLRKGWKQQQQRTTASEEAESSSGS